MSICEPHDPFNLFRLLLRDFVMDDKCNASPTEIPALASVQLQPVTANFSSHLTFIFINHPESI